MPGRAVAGELGKLEQKARDLTPFEKEVAQATRRRNANKKRERALALRQSVTVRHRRGVLLTPSALALLQKTCKRLHAVERESCFESEQDTTFAEDTVE